MKPKRSEKDEDVSRVLHTKQALKKHGFTIKEKLNYGSFSKVYKALYERDGHVTDVAVKVIDLAKTSIEYKLKFIPRELYMLRHLKHASIAAIYEILTIQNVVFIFMELAEGGDLLDYLKKRGAIAERKAQVWFTQIAEALQYMHRLGVAHRDLKSENILIDKHGNAKFTDFGFSRNVFDAKLGKRVLSETYCGSAAYVAPEVLRGQPYNAIIADIWGLGVVFYVMVNNALPFDDRDLATLIRNQIKQKWFFNSNEGAK